METFLDLKIKEVDLSGIAAKAEKMKRNERFLKYSRRERKVKKYFILYYDKDFIL